MRIETAEEEEETTETTEDREMAASRRDAEEEDAHDGENSTRGGRRPARLLTIKNGTIELN